METAFISTLSFEESKRFIFYLPRNRNRNYIIHTNFYTFCCKSNGVENDRDIVHYYLPFDDIKITNIIKFLQRKYSKFQVNFLNSKKILNLRLHPKKKQRVALIVHESLTYGNLYKKSHFFSEKEKSPLHINNVLLLNRIFPKNREDSFIEYVPLKTSFL